MGLYWRGSGRTAATQQCCSSSGGPGRRRGCRWWRGGWGANSEGWCDPHAGPKAFVRWAPAGSAKPRRPGLNRSLLAKVVHQDDPAENTPPPRTDITRFAAGYEALNMPSHTPKEKQIADITCYLSWFWDCVCLFSLPIRLLCWYLYCASILNMIRMARNHIKHYSCSIYYTILYDVVRYNTIMEE